MTTLQGGGQALEYYWRLLSSGDSITKRSFAGCFGPGLVHLFQHLVNGHLTGKY